MTNPLKQREHSSAKKYILFISGLLVGAVLLWLSIKDTDMRGIVQVLSINTNFWYAIPFTVSFLVFGWFKALRWGYLLTTVKSGSHKDRFAAVVIGYVGNLILPAQMGELVRTYVLSKQLQVPAMPIFTSIALERIFDLIVMLIFLLIAMLHSKETFPWMHTLGYTLAMLIFTGLIICYVYIRHTRFLLRVLKAATNSLPGRWQKGLLGLVEQGAAGMGSLRHPMLFTQIMVSSCLMWLAMVSCTYLALVAVGINLPFTVAVFTFTVIIGGMMLPASPGFIGTIQFCFVLVLGHYGVPKDLAIASSLFYHLLISVPILIIGYFLAIKMGFSAGQLRREVDQIGSATDDH